MSRERVLANVRQALQQARPAGATLPARPAPPAFADLRARFSERALHHACSIQPLASLSEVPAAVRSFLALRSLPARIKLARPLADLPWPEDLLRDDTAATIDTRCAVTLAVAGIAENGTLVMCSGPDSPITHHYVPEFEIVVLHAADIVANQEAAWVRVRARGAMPRAVNLIAGPSRTGDVEQTIQIGAHGPRALHVLCVG